jgi:hypothetical protein
MLPGGALTIICDLTIFGSIQLKFYFHDLPKFKIKIQIIATFDVFGLSNTTMMWTMIMTMMFFCRSEVLSTTQSVSEPDEISQVEVISNKLEC